MNRVSADWLLVGLLLSGFHEGPLPRNEIKAKVTMKMRLIPLSNYRSSGKVVYLWLPSPPALHSHWMVDTLLECHICSSAFPSCLGGAMYCVHAEEWVRRGEKYTVNSCLRLAVILCAECLYKMILHQKCSHTFCFRKYAYHVHHVVSQGGIFSLIPRSGRGAIFPHYINGVCMCVFVCDWFGNITKLIDHACVVTSSITTEQQ